MVKFANFCSQSLHRLTDRRCALKFREIYPTEIGEIMRHLPENKTISTASQTVAAELIAPKICQGQPPTLCSE